MRRLVMERRLEKVVDESEALVDSGRLNQALSHSGCENELAARPRSCEYQENVLLSVSWFIRALRALLSNIREVKEKSSTLEKVDAQLCFVLVELTTFSTEITSDDVKVPVDAEIKEEVDPLIWSSNDINNDDGLEKEGDIPNAVSSATFAKDVLAEKTRPSSNVELSFECEKCGKIFSKRQHLNSHITRAHGVKKKSGSTKTRKSKNKGGKEKLQPAILCTAGEDQQEQPQQEQPRQEQPQQEQPQQEQPQKEQPQQQQPQQQQQLLTAESIDGSKSPLTNSFGASSGPLLIHGNERLIPTELDSDEVSLPAFLRDVVGEGGGGCGGEESGVENLMNETTNLSIPSPLFQHAVLEKRHVAAKSTDRFLIDAGNDRNSQSGCDDPYYCEVCGLKFSLIVDLKSHKRKLHPEEKQECEFCKEKFPNKLGLKRHKSSSHGAKGILCPECGKQFSFVCAMRNHQKAVHGSQRLPCETCGKEFSTKIYLVKHRKEVHEGQRPRHLCTICGKKVFILKSHMESVHLGVKYPCEKCGKEFSTPPGLKVHIQTFHEGNKYPCTICDKVFGHKGYLKNHVDMVHKGKKFPCKVCHKEFNDARSRRQHTESEHQGKKHTCSHCHKDFTRHDHLMRHKQSVHEGRRFPCHVCGKEFSQSGDLKRHADSAHLSPPTHSGSGSGSKSVGDKSRLAPVTVKTIVTKVMPAVATSSSLSVANILTQAPTAQQQQQPQFALQTQSMPHSSIGLSLQQYQSSSLQLPGAPQQQIMQHPQQHAAGDILASAAAAAAVTADDFLMTSLGLLQQHQLQQNVMLQHHGVQSEEAKVEMPLMGVDSSNHVQSLLKSL